VRRLLALPFVTLVGLLAAGAANAGRIQQTLDCEGLGTVTVTVTTTNNDHSVAWGTGKVSSSLHGIPVSFSVTVTDLTTNTVLVSSPRPKATATATAYIVSPQSPALVSRTSLLPAKLALPVWTRTT
jgi:hypothetical protein